MDTDTDMGAMDMDTDMVMDTKQGELLVLSRGLIALVIIANAKRVMCIVEDMEKEDMVKIIIDFYLQYVRLIL